MSTYQNSTMSISCSKKPRGQIFLKIVIYTQKLNKFSSLIEMKSKGKNSANTKPARERSTYQNSAMSISHSENPGGQNVLKMVIITQPLNQYSCFIDIKSKCKNSANTKSTSERSAYQNSTIQNPTIENPVIGNTL